MKESFERVARYLYKRQYRTATGQWHTAYYGIFTDWQGKRQKVPLGPDLKAARDGLTIRLAENVQKVDFYAQRQQAREEAQRMTLKEWGDLYFSKMINPELRSGPWQKSLFEKRLSVSPLGEMFIDEIDEAAVDDYRDRRLRDPLTKFNGKEKRHKAVKGRRVKYSTVNRELAILRILLRAAKRRKRIKVVPEFNLQSEKQLKRDRVASQEEMDQILAELKRHWQRPVIGLLETAMRVQELLKLTWEKVDEKAGVIRLKAADVKEKRPRVVPISPTLQVILNELKAERRKDKVTALAGRVFVHGGKPIKTIRRAFEIARDKVGVKDLHLHDLRHTTITRWAMAGVPVGAIMAAAGHYSIEMHNRYVNLNERHLKEAFKLFPSCSQETFSAPSVDSVVNVSH